MGGGAGFAFLAPHSVVTERAVFSMPEVFIGYYPDSGSCYFLGRQLGPVGMFLGLTGTRLSGAQIAKLGLASHFVESSKIKQIEQSLLQLNEPNNERVDKLLRSFDTSLDSVKLPFDVNQVNDLFTANSVEQIFDNLERDPSEWATKTLKLMQTLPPSSLKLTFHLYDKARKDQISVEQSLVLCNTIFNNCYDNEELRHDFIEGVRAVLVDKDFEAKWKPASLKELDDEFVKSLFTPLHDIM
jgi:enoyl-CoA hydratase/carnithine racemase